MSSSPTRSSTGEVAGHRVPELRLPTCDMFNSRGNRNTQKFSEGENCVREVTGNVVTSGEKWPNGITTVIAKIFQQTYDLLIF